MFKLKVDYPDRQEEYEVIERMAHPVNERTPVAVASLNDIISARELLDKIYIDEKIIGYILDLVIATRPGRRKQLSERQAQVEFGELENFITFGASPRASIALVLAGKALALLRGRAYVLPQDIKEVAPDVLRHRLVLSYMAEAENIDADAIIDRLLANLHTP